MAQFSTPMMKQYLEIKKQYSDCLLFFRLGDFYELFMEDAKIGAKIMDITLTSRDRGKDGRIPMAGVPYHAVDNYLAKLVKAGYKVAICEQVTESAPGETKPDSIGLVEREVVRVVTPGTVTSDQVLDRKQNNYLIALLVHQDQVGLAIADLSTGEFRTTQWQSAEWEGSLKDELTRLSPAECILPDDLYNRPDLLRLLKTISGMNIYPYADWDRYAADAKSILKDHFNVKTLAGFGLENQDWATKAAAALLGYLKATQKEQVSHLTRITSYQPGNYLLMDTSTMMNLELFTQIRGGDKKGTLIHVLDQTQTAMGARLLRHWLQQPLTDKSMINQRLEAVDQLLAASDLRKEIWQLLKQTADMERLVSRLAIGSGNARDLIQLSQSLSLSLEIKQLLKQFDKGLLARINQGIDPEIAEVAKLIADQIAEEPPIDIKQGRMFKSGINEQLDQLRDIQGGGKAWMNKFAEQEKQRTKIQSLKVKFNKVFGFYIEVSKSNLSLVPDNYIRKQTLVNAERFITPELKEQEEKVLSAEDEINKLEFELFNQLVSQVLEKTTILQRAAKAGAALDCLTNFAQLAEKYDYCRPEITGNGELIIKQGRHPVVEQLLENEQFVPNDVTLNHEDQQLLIITGPNMAGKSVFIRQVAVITLMAQMGCFVPAESGRISVVDRIFVRSGAADVIAMGLSTFMVEMVETAQILHHATQDSLVVMDEIGRGTSTYDGVSIAWAVAEYLVNIKQGAKSSGPKALFATHYHELQALADKYSQIKNFQMAVEEHEGEPVFLHQVIPGGASHSYGIAVAKLAGVPQPVLQRAIEVLNSLEERGIKTPVYKMAVESANQLSFLKDQDHPVVKQLKELEVNSLTPIEALQKLAEWKEKL